ncbi:MAG: DUF3737 family protein [Bacteroidaceae bacterium]|nr:DUF3737 family protein [Bacteroidaceae bacterium]MBR0542961.1 DUF3737 family protein [Bacteroidaceae bacterium]
MVEIKDKEFGGERPLYALHDARLERVTIHVGESSIKESGNIEAYDCTFQGKYVFWECRKFLAQDCRFDASARSSLWYSENGRLVRCHVDAPKMFRRMQGIALLDCHFTDAQETLWDCNGVDIKNCLIENADYFGMHTDNVRIDNLHLEGNYGFQYSRNVEIKNSLLNSKDALWDSENVTITDCEINGEYLAWYSRGLTLVRCHITGEQPLCYCEDLTLVDCTFGADANLMLEYSTVRASIKGDVTSIKNPTSGSITVAGHIGEIIIDQNRKAPADCTIHELHAE